MKFRNIIILLFAVTVFSSAYSMREGRISPLSQEVDPDTGARINYISPCIFSWEVDYNRFNDRITKFNNSFENCLKYFSEGKIILSNDEFFRYKREEYNYWVNYIGLILELESEISEFNDLGLLFKNQLIIFLGDVEQKLNFLLDLYMSK